MCGTFRIFFQKTTNFFKKQYLIPVYNFRVSVTYTNQLSSPRIRSRTGLSWLKITSEVSNTYKCSPEVCSLQQLLKQCLSNFTGHCNHLGAFSSTGSQPQRCRWGWPGCQPDTGYLNSNVSQVSVICSQGFELLESTGEDGVVSHLLIFLTLNSNDAKMQFSFHILTSLK